MIAAERQCRASTHRAGVPEDPVRFHGRIIDHSATGAQTQTDPLQVTRHHPCRLQSACICAPEVGGEPSDGDDFLLLLSIGRELIRDLGPIEDLPDFGDEVLVESEQEHVLPLDAAM